MNEHIVEGNEMVTFGVINADTGGFVGNSEYTTMPDVAKRLSERWEPIDAPPQR